MSLARSRIPEEWTMVVRVAAALLAAATAFAISSCTDDGPRDESFTLDNGAVVHVTAAGGLEVEVDGRVTFALSEEAAPRAHTFFESWSGDIAIFQVSRGLEEVFSFDRFDGAEGAAEGVSLAYRSSDGDFRATLTVSPVSDESTRVRLEVAGEATSIAIPVRCDPEGTFHGFGEQYNATDQRGEAFQLIVSEQGIGRDGDFRIVRGDAHTTYFPMPYYLDARGFGVLLETDYPVDVDLCATDPLTAWLDVYSGEPLELLLFHGPAPVDVVRQLGDVVGRPAQPPDWAFGGVWIGAQGGREEVLDEAARLEAAEVPVTALWVQDVAGVRRNVDGGWGVQFRWVVDEELYPDLGGTISELRSRGIRFLVYANPFVDPSLDDHYPELAARGLLIQDSTGEPYVHAAPNGNATHPDLSNAEARGYVADALADLVTTYGIDGWMADYAEYVPIDVAPQDGTAATAYHNLYPLAWHGLNRQVMDEVRPDGDWITFARSGWTGVQEVAQIHWAGDQEATWSETDGLPTVVPALINLGLAGQPYVTHDIAGFSGGPSTAELYLRWTELGAFTPIMRTHEGNRRLDNWCWDTDESTTAHFRRFARVHDHLAPELRQMAEAAHERSTPMVRHMMLAFPEDPETYELHDQYMLGDELLVAPVLEEGATSRSVYLPAGTWYHVWTGDSHDGGRTIEVDAPIGSPPVFSLGRDRSDLRAIE